MTNNQVTVNGPKIDEPGYSIRTAYLLADIPFELPDGRWGIRFNYGAVLFGNYVCHTTTFMVTYHQLLGEDYLRWCRKLSGKVEITYTPKS